MPLPLSRRFFLGTAAAALAAPGLSRAAARPALTHGVQTGDVTPEGAMIWARADREAAMEVEWSTTERFALARKAPLLPLTAATGFAGKMMLTGLPADQTVFFRVTMVGLTDDYARSEPVVGRFRTPPATARDVRFVWSGDVAGQGWGIDEARGGMVGWRTMLGRRPDFMIHSGDTVYADGPLKAEVELKDGTLWKNVMTEEKSKVAETLDEYRGQWLYNLLDANVRAFNAETPVMAQWDDHEVTNNWFPGRVLEDERYQVRDVNLLAARSARAFHEMNPTPVHAAEPNRVYRKVAYGPHLDIFFLDMRTYRGPNDDNRQVEGAAFLGAEQMAWLRRELAASTATWKVIASDMPLGLIVWHDFANRKGFENGANGDGPALGREVEISELLSFIKHAKVMNTVWLTADVHYAASHHYSPDRAQFQDFEPFWEFVSGPLHAGTFGPGELDDTFGPEARFVIAPSAEEGQNLPPSMGKQFFGQVDIEGATGRMTVRHVNTTDEELWSITLDPETA